MVMHTEHVTVEGLSGYLARPSTDSQAGVLIQPSHWGMEEHAIDKADKLAAAGLTALVWNQYADFPKLVPTHEESSEWGAQLSDERALEQMAVWLTHMQHSLGLKRLGALGFCQGGRFALLIAARDPRIESCATYYPTIRTPMAANQTLDVVALASDIPCPVQFVYGGQDHITGWDTFAKLRDNLSKRPAPTVVQLYPVADHGFMTTELHPGAGNAQAVDWSWPQAVAFLSSTLSVGV
jgi:carboxymethylenebutenolidase